MALRVWLPLNGTLDNIGISDVTVTNNGATVDNNGKIGKCYSFDGTDDGIKITMPSGMTSLKNSSITFGGKGNRSFGGISHDGGATLATCTFYTSGQFANGNGTYVNGGAVSTTDGHHYAVTVSNDTIVTYCDGVQVTSIALASNIVTDITSSNFIEIGCDHPGGDEYGTIKVNDFRIYDHCLSPKEVKEISQGLILHYKLDGFNGGANENLTPCGGTYTRTSPGTTTKTATDGGAFITNSAFEAKPSATYTISVECDGTLSNRHAAGDIPIANKPGSFGAYVCNADTTKSGTTGGYDRAINLTSANNNYRKIGNRYVGTITLSSTEKYLSLRTNSYSDGSTSVTINGGNIKVEEGTEMTPGTLPSTIGEIDTTKIPDSSGYERNGVITGTLETNSSDRYLISTKFPTNTCYITLPAITYSNFGNSYTFSWGEYMATVSGGPMPWGFSDGNRLNCYHTTNLCGNTGDGGNNPFTPTKTAASLVDNNWHHMVITGDGTTTKLYIDGSLWGNATTYKTLTGTQIYISGGNTSTSYKMTGNSMSDFRIYATALSAEDILDLYHTSASVDNEKRLHSFEFVEQSGNMFAGSPMTGTVTWDATNNYYTITSNPSTSTWGIGPAVGTSPKKIIPGGMSYILTYEVYSPTAAQGYIDYNNYDPTTSLSGNDNDNGRLRTGVNVPANTGTLITYGCSNTNETKNPDHLPLYDYSTGLGPVMTNISSAITWHMRNPQGYLVDADNKEHVYENGVFQANFLKEDNQSSYTSFRNEEKAAGAHGYIEK